MLPSSPTRYGTEGFAGMTAEIIAVGTELLLGDVLDTDSRYLSRKLSELGISLLFRQTVGDNPSRLAEALTLALSRSDTVLLCGGLGPTPDDLTKETAARVMGVELVEHAESLRRIEAFFRRSGREMTANNRKQALLPKGATVFPNECGTAPGCAIEKEGKRVLLFPGPPGELVPMFEKCAVPYLAALSGAVLRSHRVRVFGLGEAAAVERAEALLGGENPTVAPYVGTGEMHFRVTARADSAERADAMCAPAVEELCRLLGSAVYGVDTDSLEQTAVSALRAAGKTIATAESLTGGLLSSRLTSVPGASGIFSCGVCAYSGEIKQSLLRVPRETIARTGTVSRETAGAMARGVRALARSDIGLASTGVAGPDPLEDKAVGTAFVALADGSETFVRALTLSGDREKIRFLCASHALDMLRLRLAGKSPGERLADDDKESF